MSLKSQLLSQTDDLNWPLLALVIFVVTFTVVAIRVWKQGGDATHEGISRLPLADDTDAPTFPRGDLEEVL